MDFVIVFLFLCTIWKGGISIRVNDKIYSVELFPKEEEKG